MENYKNRIRKFNESISSKDISTFVSKLFEIRDKVHFYHLKTDSFAKHDALDDLYSDILGKIDEFVEVYQGEFDIIDNYDINIKLTDNDPLKYLLEVVDVIKNNYDTIEKSYLLNILDEIVALIYRTIYKLKRFTK